VHSVDDLVELLADRRIFVLAGAGCSTESGIPDYRGPETRHRARNPIQFRAFASDAAARQRYWARAYLGWRRMRAAQPNRAHFALAALERAGHLTGLVTQNVDGLHHAAGSRTVVELHGALRRVGCLSCGALVGRDEVQAEIEAQNPWIATRTADMAPDGDAELTELEAFLVPACGSCGGPLKPDVVFFGENVPRERVEQAWSLLGSAERVLVVGSSLTVFSGYRFVKRAWEAQLPIGIVNLGESRGDGLATVRVDGRAGDVLGALVEHLGLSLPAQPA
jgi:NAD+-dependent protein deacetylase sirtuin 4